MTYKLTTPVPNVFFDAWLPLLTESEIKILLVVIRQTWGWVDKLTGGRKERDRISGWQFRQKTGLSKRIITKAINALSDKGLLEVSDYSCNRLIFASDRKGRKYLYYRSAVQDFSGPKSSAQSVPEPAHKGYHNKTNSTKRNRTLNKGFSGHVSELVTQKYLTRNK